MNKFYKLLILYLSIFIAGCDGVRLRKIDRQILNAAAEGDTSEIVALIADGANVNVRSFDGRKMTPLLWAVSKLQWDAAGILIENGADIDVADAGGLTVLDYAQEDANTPGAAHCLQLINNKLKR